ncbi:Protein of unknown function [Bacillus sp. OV166]|nr:Protein of unknown function [Bacillus sp. OV166]
MRKCNRICGDKLAIVPLQFYISFVLSKKSIDEIVDFEFIFESYMKESYQSHLWGAAYLIMGGCSDDSFDYFRGWLISQGQEVYEKTLKDPEFLANYITDENLVFRNTRIF